MSGATSIFQAATGEPLLPADEANERVLDLIQALRLLSVFCYLKMSGFCYLNCKATPYCKMTDPVMYLPFEELPFDLREELRGR